MLPNTTISEKALDLSRCLAIITAIAAPISTAATSITAVTMLAVWLLSGRALQTITISFRHPVGKTILLFAAWLIFGSLYAETDWHTKLQTLSSWKKLFFVYLLLGLFTERPWQKRLVHSYAMFMTIAGIVAIPLWALDLVVRSGREPGIFMTNHSSQSLAFVAAVLCCLFLAHEASSKQYKRWLWMAGALFLFNIFFVSTARSGYLALPPAALFAGISLYGYKKLPQLLVMILGVLSIAFLSSTALQERIELGLQERANYQSSLQETSIGIRMVFYKNTWELIKQEPVFGYGTSSFEKTYSAHAAAKDSDWRGGSTSDPHNQYLFVWLENGLIGLLLFFAYIYSALREGLNNRPYGMIGASFLIAICASSLFNSHFKTFAEGYLLAFLLGTLLARPTTPREPNHA